MDKTLSKAWNKQEQGANLPLLNGNMTLIISENVQPGGALLKKFTIPSKFSWHYFSFIYPS